MSRPLVLSPIRDGAHKKKQPLYNTVRFNTVLDITRFKDGSRKCIDDIEKMTINCHFFNIIYTFLFGYNTLKCNRGFVYDVQIICVSINSLIANKRLAQQNYITVIKQ